MTLERKGRDEKGMRQKAIRLTSATSLSKDSIARGREVLCLWLNGSLYQSVKLGAEAHVPPPIFHDFAAVRAFEIDVHIGGVGESKDGTDDRGEDTPVA